MGEIKTFSNYMAADSPLNDGQKLCTCGAHVRECSYWQRVLQGLNREFGLSAISVQDKDPARFEAHNAAVFKTVLELSGKRIVCDSSKNYSRLKRLLRSKRFEVLIVHLVRDSRAVACSYIKRGQNPFKIAYNWQRAGLFERLWLGMLRRRSQYVLVRYEDLVESPEAVLSRILAKVGLEFEEGQVRFWEKTHHNLGGNPMRHRMSTSVQKDIRYLSALTPAQWRLCTLVSVLGLKVFGYALRRQSVLKDNATQGVGSKP